MQSFLRIFQTTEDKAKASPIAERSSDNEIEREGKVKNKASEIDEAEKKVEKAVEQKADTTENAKGSVCLIS
jgi:hypothetical protein